ncbi:unnamed protein product [Bursaphelenchus okinawaensis]|uniref:HMG box domain-containing protein n=1 Tax=Bursaphelenchus okinawaensis TaxID=465554 RepID=A0A811KRV7_9BILA|nr:unnamed protein product [Bursaphelenchus okinawaensis]CAG9110761.1 unnamed protein product [Bursaphelenchus okinawaensis]
MAMLARTSLSKAFQSACSLSWTSAQHSSVLHEEKDKKVALPPGYRAPRIMSLVLKDTFKDGMSIKDAGKLAGERFKSLSETEKKEYEAKISEIAEQRRKEFEALSEEEKQKAYNQAKERRDQRRAHKHRITLRKYNEETNRPKQPSNQYALYVKKRYEEERPETHKVKEFFSKCAEDWRGLSADKKKPYKEEADQLKDKYLAELEEWKKTHDKKAFQKYKEGLKESK